MEHAEGVDEAGVEQLGERCTLLVGKACFAPVGTGVLQVDFVVRHVEIAAGDHGFGGLEVFEELAVAPVPRHAVVDARQSLLGVGRVDVHEPIPVELERTDASLVVGVVGEPPTHTAGLLAAEHGRARVALLLGIVPHLMVALGLETELLLVRLLKLRFLQSHHVGVEAVEKLGEALFHHGAQAVHVPAHKAQRLVLCLHCLGVPSSSCPALPRGHPGCAQAMIAALEGAGTSAMTATIGRTFLLRIAGRRRTRRLHGPSGRSSLDGFEQDRAGCPPDS